MTISFLFPCPSPDDLSPWLSLRKLNSFISHAGYWYEWLTLGRFSNRNLKGRAGSACPLHLGAYGVPTLYDTIICRVALPENVANCGLRLLFVARIVFGEIKKAAFSRSLSVISAYWSSRGGGGGYLTVHGDACGDGFPSW